MLDNNEIFPIYTRRIGHQLRLIEECMELLCSAKQLIDNGSKTNGYWAMDIKDRASFVAIAITILSLLNDELKRKMDMAEETTEKAMLLVRSMRYDAQKATEEA
jgi:hypothetical protein